MFTQIYQSETVDVTMLLILSIRALLCSIALDRSEREKLFPLLTTFLQRLSVSLSSPLPLAAKYVFISVLVVIEVRVLIVHRYSGRSRGRRLCCSRNGGKEK